MHVHYFIAFTVIRSWQKKSKPTKKTTRSSKEKLVATSSESSKGNEKVLSLAGFLLYITDKLKHDVPAVWCAILACGYDLQFDRHVQSRFHSENIILSFF